MTISLILAPRTKDLASIRQAKVKFPSHTVALRLLRLPLHNQMGCVRGRNTFGTYISKSAHIEVGKERLTRPKKNRRNREMHLIDKPSLQVLPYRQRPTTDPHVFSLRGVASLAQSGLRA